MDKVGREERVRKRGWLDWATVVNYFLPYRIRWLIMVWLGFFGGERMDPCLILVCAHINEPHYSTFRPPVMDLGG